MLCASLLALCATLLARYNSKVFSSMLAAAYHCELNWAIEIWSLDRHTEHGWIWIDSTVGFNPLEAQTWQMAILLASYTRQVSTLFQSMWVAAYHYETQSLTILSSTQDCYVDCMIQAFPQMVRTICRIPQMVRDRLRNSANGPGPFTEFCKRSRTVCRIQVEVPIKTPFLEGFCRFYVQFLTFSWTICIWNAFFAKKIVPFDLL